MAQAALSQAMRQLESQVGATLFARTTRRVEVTPAGEAFLRDARRLLDDVKAAQKRVRLIGDGRGGARCCGSSPSRAIGLVGFPVGRRPVRQPTSQAGSRVASMCAR